MNYIAFGYNLSQDEKRVIHQMINILTKDPSDIFDLVKYKAESTEKDTLLVYGTKAARVCKNLPNRAKLEFPEVSRLVAGFGDEDERILAYQKLLKFKEAIREADNPISGFNRRVELISEESLPPIDAHTILKILRASLDTKHVEEWIGITKDGRKIRIASDHKESKADINLTFAELYMIKAAMDALKIKELEIVYKPNSSRESSTWRDHKDSCH